MPAGALQRARRLRAVGTTFFRLDYSGYQGYVQLDLTELSSYLPLVPCFEFGNASGTLFPCTEGRVRTIMTSAGTPRAGAFGWVEDRHVPTFAGFCKSEGGGRIAARRGLGTGHRGSLSHRICTRRHEGKAGRPMFVLPPGPLALGH